ncbi:MAG: hypothetical protein FJZ86_12510 [Chloroflexi bacterium]|nr:hypothetical protein [Chloroflexota bacterium]
MRSSKKIRSKQRIYGLHIMPIGWEDIVPRIVTEANLLKTGSTVPAAQSESKGEPDAEKVLA